MKAWLAKLILGPLGVIVRGIISAVVAAIVSQIYAEFWDVVYKFAWAHTFTSIVSSFLSPDVVKQLTPLSVGLATAGAAWAGIEVLVRQHLQAGVAAIQQAVNASKTPDMVKVDGIASPSGETVAAVQNLATHADDGIEVRRAIAVNPIVEAQVEHAIQAAKA